MKKKIYILIIAMALCGGIAFFVCGCSRYVPSGRQGMPKEYTTAYEERYGRCYDSIPYKVVALDLYSEGLSLNQENRIQGTGYNLYLSDIFVEDALVPGTYRSDTTAQPFTFLPGRDYEGTPHGMYLLEIEEDKVVRIQVLDSGYVVIRDTTNGLIDCAFTLYYRSTYGSRATYNCHFQGALSHGKNTLFR